MKKTRYYIEIYMPGGEHHDWYDVCASAPTPLYKDKITGETYCYEFSEDTSWAHNRDENNGWRWPVKLIRVEEVEVEQQVIKLPSENKYKNGYNWKAKGPNARLRKKTSSDIAADKAKKDAEFFKMREEFRKNAKRKSK